MQSAVFNPDETYSASNNTPAAVYERIKDFKIPAAVDYYARVYGFTPEVAETHYQEFLKFMSIASIYPGNTTPSDQLDEMWHAAIIQTKSYQRLCELTGSFVHHATASSPQEGAFRNTLNIYWANFGEIHPSWKEPKHKRVDGVERTDNAVVDEDCEECQVIGWCSHCASSCKAS